MTSAVASTRRVAAKATPLPAPPSPGAVHAHRSRAIHEGGHVPRDASKDFHLFYASGATPSTGCSCISCPEQERRSTSTCSGTDDAALNAECMRCATDPAITTVITLEKAQAGTVHEKTILKSDAAKSPAAFNTHVVLGESVSRTSDQPHQGWCARWTGRVRRLDQLERPGEGTFVTRDSRAGLAYRAQNNTLCVFIDPDTVALPTAELIAEHLAVRVP